MSSMITGFVSSLFDMGVHGSKFRNAWASRMEIIKFSRHDTHMANYSGILKIRNVSRKPTGRYIHMLDAATCALQCVTQNFDEYKGFIKENLKPIYSRRKL